MWRSVLLAVVLAGVLSGCSLGGGNGAGGSVPSREESGLVSGVVSESVGVAFIGKDGKVHGNIYAVPRAALIVSGATTDGRHVRRAVDSNDRGRFRIYLPTGRYWVTWNQRPGLPLNEQTHTGFTVQAGHATTVQLRDTNHP
jgi:hypothetical protein